MSDLLKMYKENENSIKNSVTILVTQMQIEMDQFENVEKLYGTNKMKQVEFQIQIDRICNLMDSLILKLKLVFCLPILIKDNKMLKEHLNCEKLKKTIEAFKEYYIGVRPDISVSETLQHITKTIIIEEIINYIDQISTFGKNLLKLLDELKHIIKLKMEMTAPRETAKEKLLHSMWRNNEKTKEKINAIKERLAEEENILEKNLTERYNIIEQYQNEIKNLSIKSQEEVEKQILDSSNEMIQICDQSKKVQKNLNAELNKFTTEYNQLLIANLKKEGKIREQKKIVQQTLKSRLNKYDMDIGEKTKELNQEKCEFDETSEKFNIWMIEFKRQEDEYNTLMKEKLAEEKKKQEERLLLFMMNRAAITIQQAFRRILAKKKKQKKKGKKGKK